MVVWVWADAIRYVDFALALVLVARMVRVAFLRRYPQAPGFGCRMAALALGVVSTTGYRIDRLHMEPDWRLVVDTLMLVAALIGVWRLEDQRPVSDIESQLRAGT